MRAGAPKYRHNHAHGLVTEAHAGGGPEEGSAVPPLRRGCRRGAGFPKPGPPEASGAAGLVACLGVSGPRGAGVRAGVSASASRPQGASTSRRRGAGVSRPRSPAERAKLAAQRLAREYPGTALELCELDFASPWQLLVVTVLSAQTTDERVNSVSPALIARFPTPEALAAASTDEVEELIRPTGFFRAKARSLVSLARALCERSGGEVPSAMEDLVSLPGVGRKTANVVRSVGFGLPGLPVDTHVGRLSRRLGLTQETDPDRVEAELTSMLPSREWGAFSLRLILHGRRVCSARRPRCTECVLADFCPSANLPVRPPGTMSKA